ncbi:MAG: Rieske 2Fe-2S domain-containing protein, partial [Prochloraceae cyanobacterium]
MVVNADLQQNSVKETEQTFKWTKNWYPVSPIDYLKPNEPNPMTILGKKLVIWKNKQNNWVVMDDLCPHKLVELSKGKIDSDAENIVCRYHGWCFDSSGNCTKIPAINEADPIQKTACQNKRSKVNTYPTRVVQDLLWVWPDDSPEAETESLSSQPAKMPEDIVDISNSQWFMAEVPVGYAVSVENSFDPFHAPFVHEGESFSSKKAIPMTEYKLISEITKEGFKLEHTGYSIINRDWDMKREFRSPCSNTTVYTFNNGKKTLFQLYFVPTKPGYSLNIVQFLGFPTIEKKNFLQRLLPEDLAIGLKHSSLYTFADQDLNIISTQEIAYSQINKTWSKAYYLPTTSDFGAGIFRKWLEEFAGGDPFGETKLEPISEDKLYDRWHRHSKYCPHCRKSVEILEKISNIWDRIAKISILLAAIAIISPIPLKIGAVLIILGLLSFWASIYTENKRHDFISSIPKRGIPEVKLY